MIAARETCHALGLPHVTLDLREEFRRAVVDPFVRGYARGETPNPCGRCNGSFRFAELLAFARRAGAAKLWTGHYARIVERDGRRLLARAVDPEKDQSYMLAQLDPRLLGQIEFPLGEQDKATTRAEAASAGLAAATRRESQEACFLAGDDYRAFLGRRGLEADEGAILDEDGVELGRHDGYWRYTPGQRRGLGVAAGEPLYAIRTDAAANTVTVGPRASLACTSIAVRGRLHVPVARAETKVRYRSPALPASVTPRPGGFTLELETPPTVSPQVRSSRCTTTTLSSGQVWSRPGTPTRITRMPLLAVSAGDVAYYALAFFLVATGAGLAYVFLNLGATFARLSSFIRGTEHELLPVIHKLGESVDKVNLQLDKVDQVTDSAVDMADSADTAVRAVSMAIARPVEKVSGFAAGLSHGVSAFRSTRNWNEAVRQGKEAATRRERDLEEELRHAEGGTQQQP